MKNIATFAGGCFWCMQPPFDKTEGVLSTAVGYLGGSSKTADYKSVCSGATDHYEVIQVEFDPKLVTYETLLGVFWKNIDPTQVDGQFADKGPQYRTAIFYHDDEQKAQAEESKKILNQSGRFPRDIATQILSATEFFLGEEYHQGYYKTNSGHYSLYKEGSGRAPFIRKVWGED